MKWLARIRAEAAHGIEICGSGEFIERTKEALHLLRSTPQFNVIQTSLDVIRQGKRSGMKAWAAKPTFIVGAATWRYSTLWYAGAIAHDAYHACLYQEAKRKCFVKEPEADTWTGVDAEKKCLAFQKQVLAHLGADQNTIAYIEQYEDQPAYQGRNKGWSSWLDYVRRRW